MLKWHGAEVVGRPATLNFQIASPAVKKPTVLAGTQGSQ